MSKVIKIDNQEFELLLNSGEKHMVKFFSPTCVPCKMLDNVLNTIDDINIYAIDVTKHPQIAAQYGVMGVPTTIVFENGAEKGRKIGFQKKEVLLEIL